MKGIKKMSINISKPYAPPFDDYMMEIKDIWETRMFTNVGSKHKKLERKLEKYLNAKKVSLFTNGHLALETALEALELKGEIITTPFTFSSTIQAIVRRGLRPVFCDINESDFTLNTDLIEDYITDKTCAILPVHIYGNVCDVNKFDKLSKKTNLPIIYDAAHAFGVKYNNIDISNYGTISMFSFHATKVYHTVEGGCLAYNDLNLEDKFSKIRNFGLDGDEAVISGFNAKMTEIHAAMGLCNLLYIQEQINRRKVLSDRYDNKLNNVKGIRLNNVSKLITRNYAYYPIRVIEGESSISRDRLIEILKEHDIHVRKYYHPLVSQYKIFENKYDINDTPIASKIANEIIVLPLYPDLKEREIDKICNIIIEQLN